MKNIWVWAIGGGLAIWYFVSRQPAQGAVTIEQQLVSIWPVFVDAWVYRNNTWLLYDKANPMFREFISINPGETVWVQVSANATLIYGPLTIALVPGGNWPVVWP